MTSRRDHSPLPEWLQRPAVTAGVILLAAFIVYSPALGGSFLWDDDRWTTSIAHLLLDLPGLGTIWTHPLELQQYYPLTATTFWIDHQLWGWWTLPYHVENVLLHGLSAWLFWRLLVRLEVRGARLAALIFALHPLMVESVAWITERKNVLSLVMYLGGVILYGRFARFWSTDETEAGSAADWKAYGGAFLLCLAALLSKATAFSFPAVLLVICWWKRGTIRFRRDFLPTVPFFAIAGAMSMTTAWIEKNHLQAQGEEWQMHFLDRVLIAGRVLWFYAAKLVWPSSQCFVYPRWEPDVHSAGQWLFPLAAIGVVAALWLARKRVGRGPTAAVLLYVGTLFPVLGFMNPYFARYSFVSDHWVYVSSLSLIALGAAVVTGVAGRIGNESAAMVVQAALLLPLAGLSWHHAHVFRSSEILWRDTIAKNPGTWMAHVNLAKVLEAEGRLPEAEQASRRAYEILEPYWRKKVAQDPASAIARINLGNVLLLQGKGAEAEQELREAARLRPGDKELHFNLANQLFRNGKIDEAVVRFRKALELAPGDADARYNLAVALTRLNRTGEAIEEFRLAIRYRPDFARAYSGLGGLLAKSNRTGEAIAAYREALRLDPSPDAEARLQALTGPAERH